MNLKKQRITHYNYKMTSNSLVHEDSEELIKELNRYQEVVKNLKERSRFLEDTLINTKNEKDITENNYNTSYEQLNNLKKQWTAIESEYTAKIDKLVIRQKDLEQELDKVLFERNKFEKKLEKHKRLKEEEYMRMSEQVEKIENDVNMINAENAQYKVQVMELGKYKEKYIELKAELDAKDRMIKELKDKLKKSKDSLHNYKTKLDEFTLSLINLKGADKAKQDKKEIMMNGVESLQAKLRSIRLHNK